jgi:hypothetical protein
MKLYIGETRVILNDFDYSLRLGVTDLININTRKAFKTGVLKVPISLNKELFNFHENINSEGFATGQIGTLYDEIICFRGEIIMYDTTIVNGIGYYQIQLVAASIFNRLKENDLIDLDISEANHTFTNTNAEATWAEDPLGTTITAENCYYWHLCDVGTFSGKKNVGSNPLKRNVLTTDLLPATSIWFLLNQMLKENNYKFDSTYISTQLLQSYYLLNTKLINEYDYNETDMEFEANITADVPNVHAIPASQSNYRVNPFAGNTSPSEDVVLDNEEKDNGNNYNTTTGIYTCPEDGSYRFLFFLWALYEDQSDITLKSGGTVTIYIEKGASVLAYEVWSMNTSDTQNMYLDIGTDFLTLNQGDQINIKIVTAIYVDSGAGANRNVTLTYKYADDNTVFKNKVSKKRGIDLSIDYNNYLPDVKQIEILKSVIHIDNLQLLVNENEKTVYIEPFDDFYETDNYMDWTSKLNKKKPIKILSQTKNPVWQKYLYKYKDDGNDRNINEQYEDYGSDSYEPDDFTKIGTNEIVNNLVSPTLNMPSNEIGLIVTEIMQLWQEHEGYPIETRAYEEGAPERSLDFNYRIGIWNYEAKDAGEAWYLDKVAQTHVPYLDFTDLKFVTKIDEYDQQNKEYDSRPFQAYFDLSKTDINNFINCVSGLDLRTPAYLDDPDYNGFFRIVDINYRKNNSLVTLKQIKGNIK